MIRTIMDRYDWTIDPRWDNKAMTYDTSKHNWSEFFMAAVRELKPDLDKFENIHLYFKTTELVGLRQHLERLTNSAEFSRRLDSFFEDYMPDLVDYPDYLIQATTGIRIVVPDQQKLGRLLSFHTGYWTGYSNDMNTVWIPLNRVYGSNTMQVIGWDKTIELMNKIHDEQLDLDQIDALCTAECYPVEIDVGQCWLFNQGHLHGNINNDTGISRLSFDARCARVNGDFGPRRAGSFFRLRGTHASIDPTKLSTDPWIVFTDPNSSYIGDTPYYMIREYLMGVSKQLGLRINEWSNEYHGCTWMPKFRNYVSLKNIGGIMVPSIHGFSGTKELCFELYKIALDNNIQILFVDEKILLTSAKDLDIIERILAAS